MLMLKQLWIFTMRLVWSAMFLSATAIAAIMLLFSVTTFFPFYSVVEAVGNIFAVLFCLGGVVACAILTVLAWTEPV